MGALVWQDRVFALMDLTGVCAAEREPAKKYLHESRGKTFEAAWNQCRSTGRMTWLINALHLEQPDHDYFGDCWCFSPKKIRAHFPATVVLARLEGEEGETP